MYAIRSIEGHPFLQNSSKEEARQKKVFRTYLVSLSFRQGHYAGTTPPKKVRPVCYQGWRLLPDSESLKCCLPQVEGLTSGHYEERPKPRFTYMGTASQRILPSYQRLSDGT